MNHLKLVSFKAGSPTRVSTEHDSNDCSDGDGSRGKSDVLNGSTEASDLGAGRETTSSIESETSNDVKMDAPDRSKTFARRLPNVELNQCDDLSETPRTNNCETSADKDNCASLESNRQCDSPSRLDVSLDDHPDEKSQNQQSALSPSTSNSHLNSFGAQAGDLVNQSVTGKEESSNAAHSLSQVSTSDNSTKVECEEEIVDKSREASNSNTSPLLNAQSRKRSASQTESQECPSGDTLSSETEECPNVGTLVSKRLHVDLSETSTTGHENDGNP